MTGTFDIFTFTGIMTVGQSLFMSSMLFLDPKIQSISKGILLLLLFILTFNIAHDTLIQSKLFIYTPQILYLGEAFNFLVWPLLYLLLQRNEKRSFKWFDLFHFAPFVWFNFSRISLYLSPLASKQEAIEVFYKTWLLIPEINAWDLSLLTHDFLIWRFQGLFYIVLIAVLLSRNKFKRPTSFIRFIYFSFVILWCAKYASFMYNQAHASSILLNNQLEIIFRAGQVMMLSVLIIRNPIKPKKEQVDTKKQLDTEPLMLRILELFEKERAHVQTDLSLQTLASKLNTNSHYLSQAINRGFGRNFSDFVNSHRVEEVKSRLADADYRHLTLEAIAKDAGFNSVATCHRAFKKFEGLPPSHFRRH